MSDKPKSRKDLTFDEIAEALAHCQAGSARQSELLAELQRRQTIAQIDAANAQKSSATWLALAGVGALASALVSLLTVFYR